MSEWQPIETAPKDEDTKILAVERRGDEWRYFLVYWWDLGDGQGCWGDDESFGEDVTHWMPLPEPPE